METKTKRFGFFDALILLLILLGVIGFAARVLLGYRAEAGDRQMRQVVLAVQKVHARSLDCIEVGETLYFADGTAFGVIESVDVAPAVIELTGNGVVAFGTWQREEWVDLSIAVRVWGSVREGIFLHDGGRNLLVGDQMILYGHRSAFPFLIVGYKNV